MLPEGRYAYQSFTPPHGYVDVTRQRIEYVFLEDGHRFESVLDRHGWSNRYQQGRMKLLIPADMECDHGL